jgi:hypothetical protein
MDDLAVEWNIFLPIQHHVDVVQKSIAASKLIAFGTVKNHAINDDLQGRIDEDFFNPRARDAHEKTGTFLPQTRVKVQRASFHIGMRAESPDCVRLSPVEDEWHESLLKVV